MRYLIPAILDLVVVAIREFCLLNLCNLIFISSRANQALSRSRAPKRGKSLKIISAPPAVRF